MKMNHQIPVVPGAVAVLVMIWWWRVSEPRILHGSLFRHPSLISVGSPFQHPWPCIGHVPPTIYIYFFFVAIVFERLNLYSAIVFIFIFLSRARSCIVHLILCSSLCAPYPACTLLLLYPTLARKWPQIIQIFMSTLKCIFVYRASLLQIYKIIRWIAYLWWVTFC